MPQGTFPANLDDLTPELLSGLLAERRPGVRVEKVRVLERAKCGDGLASTADRVTLGLDYAPGCDADGAEDHPAADRNSKGVPRSEKPPVMTNPRWI